MFEISLLISQFLPGFHQFLKRIPNSNSFISLNIACKCDNLYFIAISFIVSRYMKSNSVQFLGDTRYIVVTTCLLIGQQLTAKYGNHAIYT